MKLSNALCSACDCVTVCAGLCMHVLDLLDYCTGSLASAPGLYAACAALSAACTATRKGLVSTVHACIIYPEECLGFGYFSVSRYVTDVYCGNGKLF